MKILIVAATAVLCCGCARTVRTVSPVPPDSSRSMCIIQSPGSKDFLEVYTAALQERGMSVAILREQDRYYDCPLTSTYQALWGTEVTGLVPTMVYAEIQVYRDGNLVGSVMLNETGHEVLGQKAAPRIRALVAELFPQR